MVNPFESHSSAHSTSAIHQTNTGLIQQQSEEGCNDDPPPIPLPPAGGSIDVDSNTNGGRPELLAGGYALPESSNTHSNLNLPADNSINGGSTVAGSVRVFDYGQSSNGSVGKLTAPETNPFSNENLLKPSHSHGNSTATSVSTAPYPISRSSTAGSSITAVDGPSQDVVVDMPVSVYNGTNAHVVDVATVATILSVDVDAGLSTKEADERYQKDGPNKLQSDGGLRWYSVLGRQVSNSLTLVLVIAMAASFGMLDYIEGSVIAAVICLNIVIGFVQDYRAEKTMQSLNSLSAPIATVMRNSGKVEKVKAELLVKGDIVLVNVGDVVPADLRIIKSMNLETNEALLTGESLPIPKSGSTIMKDENSPIGDRQNMVWASSTVTKGRGTGIVVATAMETQVGAIAELLRGKTVVEGGPLKRFLFKIKKSTKNILGLVGTPLQVKLSKFALLLFGLAILLAIIVFSSAKWKITGENLIYGICVAVAVIPESLIAVLTITMAVGTKTMAKGNVIVRKMQALEAVGGVTNICSDKTGTLTQGKMIARKAFIPNLGEIRIDGVQDPFDPNNGQVFFGDNQINGDFVPQSKELELFLEGIAMCNLATVHRNDAENMSSEKPTSQWKATGEPTEISLQVLAMRFGLGKEDLVRTGQWELLTEHPFDSTVKKMSIVHRHNGRQTVEAFIKGAGEVVVPSLTLSDEKKEEIMAMIERFAGEGLRVLCVAHKNVETVDYNVRNEVETGMNFLGLVGLYDPPRVETRDAVRRCHIAGVDVHMLTGDHIRTATAIAHEVGILSPAMPSALAGTMVMTAGQFDALSDAEVDALPELPKVIARCSPATKVRMVEALHRRKAFCVMTGDGVNDSPALKRADVGIAMGLSGSDVAKDAADLVLTDDNFASIVRAVEEGRRLFDNIQKFIMHLLISNISQVVLLLIGLAFQDKNKVSVFPLSPLEILWVNMITSSFLALGLGLEEAAPDVMTRPPHDLRTGVFTWEVIIDKSLYGVTMGILCLISFVIVIFGANDGNLGIDCNHSFNDTCEPVFRARATVFAVLSFLLLLTAWEVKHFTRSLFRLNPERHTGPFAVFHAVWYNRFLFWAVIAGFVITFPVIYIPVFNSVVFKHTGISWEWGIVAGACVVYLMVIEGWKAIKRWRRWGSAGRKVNGISVASDLEGGAQQQVVRGEEKV